MLIDKAIEMFEDCITNCVVPEPDLTEMQTVLPFIKQAQAYDIGGVSALLSSLKKKDKFESFMEKVEKHPGTATSLRRMGQLIWMEGIPNYRFGCLVRFEPAARCTYAYVERVS